MNNLQSILINKRKELKLSLREAANLIGISHSYLSTLEKGIDSRSGSPVKPTPETLKLISKAYKIPYETLMQAAGYLDINSINTNIINDKTDNNIIGERIVQLRKENKISREELAKKLNLSYSAISKYETGARTPDDELKKRIAKYFNVSIDYLIGVSDIRNPYIEQNKEISKVDKFLLKLKEEMQKQGLDFDETSPEELIETYKLLLEFKKKTQNNKDK